MKKSHQIKRIEFRLKTKREQELEKILNDKRSVDEGEIKTAKCSECGKKFKEDDSGSIRCEKCRPF